MHISETHLIFQSQQFDKAKFNHVDVHSHGKDSGRESNGSGSMSVVEEAENEEE